MFCSMHISEDFARSLLSPQEMLIPRVVEHRGMTMGSNRSLWICSQEAPNCASQPKMTAI